MKRILYINPPNTPITDPSISIEPIDIVQLATTTRHRGYDVRVYDLDTPHENWEATYKTLIKTYNPDIVITLFDYHIPLHLETTASHVLHMAQVAKEYNTRFIVGGKMATYKPHSFIYAGSDCDIVIRYDMEPVIFSLLQVPIRDHTHLQSIDNIAYRHNNRMHTTPRKKTFYDITQLPIPDRNIIERKSYIDVRTMLSSRGCMMKCSFCHVPGFRGKWVGRSVTQVVDEIQYLIESTATKKILFLDDNATVDTKRMRSIAEEIIQRKLHVSWGCLSTIHSYSPELMAIMAQSGCKRIHYGMESADTTISKNIHKNLTPEKILAAVQGTQAVGIRVRTSRILDLPGSDGQTLQETLALMKACRSEEIRVHFLVYRMGSELYDENTAIPTQYIHHNAPQNTASSLEAVDIYQQAKKRAYNMETAGYTIIDSIEKNSVFNSSDHNITHIISFCPLRYGINR